jgi:putative Mn2+ efflux pump MntP
MWLLALAVSFVLALTVHRAFASERREDMFLAIVMGCVTACALTVSWLAGDRKLVEFISSGLVTGIIVEFLALRRRRKPSRSSIEAWNKKHGRW